MVRLNRSVCPLVCGSDGDVTFGSMKSRLHTWPQEWLVNCGPPSDSNRSGGP